MMKKLYFNTLFAALIFGLSTNVFAQEAKKKSEQKMEQLRSILIRAAKSSKQGEPPAFLDSGAPKAAEGKTAPSTQAPSAGVVAAPSAVSENGKNGQVVREEKRPKATLYEKAFSNVANQLLPMTPAQVSKLREVYTESQLAAATPPGIPPRPTSTSLLIDLSPTATPPVIRLGAGFISSLVFVDATGQPWPIAAYSLGDPTSFNIQWDQKGNTLLIQSSTFYKRSNLAVILRDLNTPIMIDLISGQKAVDYRVDLRVPGLGPNAAFAHSGVPDSANPILLNVLNGVPPKGSKELKVSGGHCQAWLLDKKLYLRTNLTVISPGWQSVMSSIDGTHAYQLQPAPIILALQNGRDRVLTLMLEGLE